MNEEEIKKLGIIVKVLENEARKQGLEIFDQTVTKTKSGIYVLFAAMQMKVKEH